MELLFVMAVVPRPDVGRLQHCRRPVITGSLIYSSLTIILSVRAAQCVRPKVGCVSRDVVAVLVIQNTSVMRGVRAIATVGCLRQCAVLQQPPTRAEMDLPVG